MNDASQHPDGGGLPPINKCHSAWRVPRECQKGLLPWKWTHSGAAAPPAHGSWMRRGAPREGGGGETGTNNACTLEEGPSQNESAVGHSGAGTPSCQAAVAQPRGISLVFCSGGKPSKSPTVARWDLPPQLTGPSVFIWILMEEFKRYFRCFSQSGVSGRSGGAGGACAARPIPARRVGRVMHSASVERGGRGGGLERLLIFI